MYKKICMGKDMKENLKNKKMISIKIGSFVQNAEKKESY